MDAKSTIGIELESKMFQIQDKYLKLNVWDTAGQERFKSVTHALYKGAKGAVIVFDVTREITFNNVDYWFKEIKESVHAKDMNLILIGNKCDLKEKREVSTEKGLEKAANMGIIIKNILLNFKFRDCIYGNISKR
jgi:small GTP-binding protein